MQWASLGFKDNPFNTEPIDQKTLPLYVGHNEEIRVCKNVIAQRNFFLVIEGARGVGTTSFSNYLRFTAQKKGDYFTPSNEIRVEAGWGLDTLLSVVIANIVREIELFQTNENIFNDKRFQNAKALSTRISKTYRSFGIEAFGFGANYGKSSGISSMPMIVPSQILGHHLEDLAVLIRTANYHNGILIQLNNLDVNTVHDEKHLKYLFNAIRDYIQIDGISWIFVGDVGLRHFIAQQVDRLDDIVSYEILINALPKNEYEDLIHKRIEFYRTSKKVKSPIDRDVFIYLYNVTKGRLRYIFGIFQRLMNSFYVGDLTDRITLDIAKPMIKKLAYERIKRGELSPAEEYLLRVVVELKDATVIALANKINKSKQYVSKTLINLEKKKLVTVHQHGRNKYYMPVLDATIAYSK